MNAGALGCEVVISGKLTGARSRVEKFVEGHVKHSGHPVQEVVDEGFAVAVKKLGTLGCKVRIIQPDVILPDSFRIKEANEILAEPAEKPAEKPVEKPAEAPKKESAKSRAPAAAPEKVAEAVEVAEPEEAEEKSQAEASEDFEEAELIYVEGSEEVRRQVNGVWQHKHESYDYWHPMARVHKEAKE
jgi:small subunit ribosomal protein S3